MRTNLIVPETNDRGEESLENLRRHGEIWCGCQWREHLAANVIELSDWSVSRLITINLRQREVSLFFLASREAFPPGEKKDNKK